MLGSRATSSLAIVPLPAPPGPIRTKMCGAPAGGSARSLFEQRLALLGTESLQSAAVADADRLHEAPGLHLAETRQGLEDRDHLHLADGLVGVRLSEKVRQGKRAHLELVL